MKEDKKRKTLYQDLPRMPSLMESMIPVVFLIIALGAGIIVLEVDPQIPLIAAIAFTALIAYKIGISWEVMEEGLANGVMTGMKALLILMTVGLLIGSWIHSGVVPTMIYYGLQILTPQIFLVASAVMAGIVSLVLGSSWTTAGTVGVALIGIGTGLGISPGLVAGSVVSGSYLGDKLSPLSDATNLAAGSVSDTDVFEHVRHMLWVTIPSFIVALIVYAVIGMQFAGQVIDTAGIEEITMTISDNFWVHPILLVVPLLVIIMIVKKIPPLPALIGGVILGGLTAVLVQGASLADIIGSMHYGYGLNTGVEVVDDLLTAGGLDGMMWTISLAMIALSLGGLLESCGFLATILKKVLEKAQTYGQISLVTHIIAVFVNITTADQYLAIILPARMFNQAFKEVGAHPKNLSRIVESAGTLTSPLIPWTTCGAFMYGVLGVNPFIYAPFAFFLWLAPLISIGYGYLGIGFSEWTEADEAEAAAESALG